MAGRDLPGEIISFLSEHGASTSSAIALGVRARRAAVDVVLAQDGFSRVSRPGGANPRAAYWNVSRRIRRPRAVRLLEILADGEWHSCGEIARVSGPGLFLTNNAATELRAQGHDVRYSRKLGAYRLVASGAPVGGAA